MLRNSLLAAGIFLHAGAVIAGLPPGQQPIVTGAGGGKYNSDKFFAGINWTFGAGPSVGPEGVIGFHSTRVKPGSVKGQGIKLTFPLSGGPQFGAVKLTAINGNRHLQGELGFGYSFLMGAPLLTGGGFGSHLMFGSDYIFGHGFRPYLGVHTMGSYRKPSGGTTTSCQSGSVLDPQDGLCYPENDG